MALNDINIEKVNGLLREAANEDRISCLICGGVEVEYGDDGTTGINKLHGPFYALEEMEDVGITAAYDTDNAVLIHHHAQQYFRGFGENETSRPAKPLYLYMVSQSTPMSVMCDKDEENSAYQAWIDSGKTIKRFMVVLNPTDLYTADTDDNGFDADCATAVAKAQECAETMHDEHAPVHFYLECRDFSPATPGDAVNTNTFEAENVTLVIIQDLDVAGIDDLHNGYAAVGAWVGLVTSKPTLADSPAEVGVNYEGNLQDKANGYFLNYGFGNIALADWTLSAQNAFYDKGYVALRVFANTSGVYGTQSFTCAKSTSDYIRSELNEVYNKAYRGIYAAYVPFINKKFKLTSDGYIPGDEVKDLERIGNKVFGAMNNADEISDGKTYIDPKQAIVTSRVLQVKFKMVPMGKMEALDGELSFTVSVAQ